MSNVFKMPGVEIVEDDGTSPLHKMVQKAISEGAVRGFLIYENEKGATGTIVTENVTFAHALGLMMVASRMLEEEDEE